MHQQWTSAGQLTTSVCLNGSSCHVIDRLDMCINKLLNRQNQVIIVQNPCPDCLSSFSCNHVFFLNWQSVRFFFNETLNSSCSETITGTSMDKLKYSLLWLERHLALFWEKIKKEFQLFSFFLSAKLCLKCQVTTSLLLVCLELCQPGCRIGLLYVYLVYQSDLKTLWRWLVGGLHG